MVIDFSSKHDVLILNPDGTYSRMDEPWYSAELIAANTWKVLSSGDYSYLLVGDHEGISIDTGYGAGNIRDYLQTLTDKPVRNVINTHHHFDHSANNSYFEKAYMHPSAFELASVPYASFEGVDFPRDYIREAVWDGDTYDLGGRVLEFFWIPDHTPDGIAILDRKERILFVGDELMSRGKTLNVPLRTFEEYLERLLAHRHEFDRLYSGAGELDISLLSSFYCCVKKILSGERGTPYQPELGGPGKLPPGPHGEVVYDRKKPHYGDGGSGKDTPDGNLYRQEYAGVPVVYDLNLL